MRMWQKFEARTSTLTTGHLSRADKRHSGSRPFRNNRSINYSTVIQLNVPKRRRAMSRELIARGGKPFLTLVAEIFAVNLAQSRPVE